MSVRYSVTCPKCAAWPGDPCRALTSGRVTDTHAARIEAAWAPRTAAEPAEVAEGVGLADGRSKGEGAS